MINSALLKNNAKEIIRRSKPNVILVCLAYILVTYVLSILSGRLVGLKIDQNTLRIYQNYIENGQFEAAASYLSRYFPSAPASFIDFLIQAVSWILNAGLIIFLLNTIRATGNACFGNLLDGFGLFFRIFILTILELLFIALWSLLLLFPGIIAAYRYRQAIYILIDNPEMSPIECITTSKNMMKDRKFELLSLDLSFIGWYILSLIPFIRVWVTPYTQTVYALYYESLRAHYSAL